MNYLSEYTKNIASFLIFMSIVGIILPSGKYKNYINLILGFILIFIIVTPLSKILGKSDYDIDILLERMFWDVEHNIYREEGKFYEDEQNKQILQVYVSNLRRQLESLVEGQEKFQIVSINLSIDDSEENFGAINAIGIKVKKFQKEIVTKQRLIKIEPIIINNNKPDDIDEKEVEDIKILKTFISNFYNLSETNINIEVANESTKE